MKSRKRIHAHSVLAAARRAARPAVSAMLAALLVVTMAPAVPASAEDAGSQAPASETADARTGAQDADAIASQDDGAEAPAGAEADQKTAGEGGFEADEPSGNADQAAGAQPVVISGDSSSDGQNARVGASTVFSVEDAGGSVVYEATGAYALRDAMTQAATALSSRDSVTVRQWQGYTQPASVTVSVPEGKTLVLDGQKSSRGEDNGTITVGAAINMITVTGTGTFKLQDATMVGGKSRNWSFNGNGQMFNMAAGSTLVLSQGALLKEGSAKNGGAVYLNQGNATARPELVMEGDARISDSKATEYYGGAVSAGVYIDRDAYADVIMRDSSVVENCEAPRVGGFALGFFSTMRMEGNAAIRDCKATKAANEFNAGGVYIGWDSEFRMTDNASISGCHSAYDGGGVFQAGRSYMELSGNASLTDNHAVAAGGAIHTWAPHVLRIADNVRITGNSGGSQVDALYGGAVVEYGNGYIQVEGNPYIYGNWRDKNDDNVYTEGEDTPSDLCGFGSANLLQVTGDLGPNAKVGVYGNMSGEGVHFATARERGSSVVSGAEQGGRDASASERSGLQRLVNNKDDSQWGAAGTGGQIVWSYRPAVTFDAQGGTFAASGKGFVDVLAEGSSAQWKAPEAPDGFDPAVLVAPADMQFQGWYAQPNGQGDEYQAGSPLSESQTYYAHWTQADSTLLYQVRYERDATPAGEDDVEGRAPADGRLYLKDGGEFTVAGNDGLPPLESTQGYRFRGWSTERNVDPDANPEKVVIPGTRLDYATANGVDGAGDQGSDGQHYGLVTLYAVWGPAPTDSFTVVYDEGSIDGASITGSAPTDQVAKKEAAVSAAAQGALKASNGYELKGWKLASDSEVRHRVGASIAYSEEADAADGALDDVIHLTGVWGAPLKDDTVFYFETSATGLREFTDLQTAVNEATQWLNGQDTRELDMVQTLFGWVPGVRAEMDAKATDRTQITIWQNKDYDMTSQVEVKLEAGDKIVLSSAPGASYDWDLIKSGADADPNDTRSTIKRTSNIGNKAMLLVSGGELELQNVVLDADGLGTTANDTGVFARVLSKDLSNYAVLTLGWGSTLQNAKVTGGAYNGALSPYQYAEVRMRDGALIQNNEGSTDGIVAYLGWGTAEGPTRLVFDGGVIRNNKSSRGAILCVYRGYHTEVVLGGDVEIYGNENTGTAPVLWHDGGYNTKLYIKDEASIHDNTGAGSVVHESGMIWNDGLMHLSGTPTFYNNTVKDGVRVDVSCEGDVRYMTIDPTFQALGEDGLADYLYVYRHTVHDVGDAFATVTSGDASDYLGCSMLRDAHGGLWGAPGEGDEIVWTDHPAMRFDANGGSFDDGAVLREQWADGSAGAWRTPAAPAEEPSWPDGSMAFAGWYTEPEGGEPYRAGQPMEANGTAYAHWYLLPTDPEDTYLLEYDRGETPNGTPVVGEAPVDDTVYLKNNMGPRAVAAENTLAAVGYLFDGWQLPNGQKVQPGDVIEYADERADQPIPEDAAATMTLTATWRAITDDDVFYVDYNAGTAPTGQTVSGVPPFDGVEGVQRAYLRDGGEAAVLDQGELAVTGLYEFAGWALENGASKADFKAGDILTWADVSASAAGSRVTLYAVWRAQVDDDTVFTVERPDLGDRVQIKETETNALQTAVDTAINYLNGQDTQSLDLVQTLFGWVPGVASEMDAKADGRQEVVVKQWKNYETAGRNDKNPEVTVNIPDGKTVVLDGQRDALGADASGNDKSGHITMGLRSNADYDYTIFGVEAGTFKVIDITVTGSLDAYLNGGTNGQVGSGQLAALTGIAATTPAQLVLSDGAVFEKGFSNNGGAVHLSGAGASMVMEGDSVARGSRVASGSGGFAFIQSGAQMTVQDEARCLDNDADLYGGFVYVDGDGSSFVATGDAEFSGNTSIAGGAIHQRGGKTYVELSGNVQAHDNAMDGTGRYYGGFAHTGSDANATFVVKDNVSITGNRDEGGNAAACGGIFIWNTPLTVEGSPTIDGNTVKDGSERNVYVYNTGNVADIEVSGPLTGGTIGVYHAGATDKGDQFGVTVDPEAANVAGLWHFENDCTAGLIGEAGAGDQVVWGDTLRLTFDANGGTFKEPAGASAKDVDAVKGVSGTWSTPAAPDGAAELDPPSDWQRFAGWAYADGTPYEEGVPVDDRTGGVVYAQWEGIPDLDFTLTYSVNADDGHFADGSKEKQVAATSDSQGNPPAAPAIGEEPKRDEQCEDESGQMIDRYTFQGWATSPRALMPDFTPGETRLSSTDQTVYAVWKDNSPDPDDESPWQLYVSEAGSDTAGDGTRANPYRTFGRAFDVVKSGTITQGEGADGTLPKDPTYPALNWATVVLLGDWHFGKNDAGGNAAAVQDLGTGSSVTVRGDTGAEQVIVDSNVSGTDLFTVPASTKMVLKRLTVDGNEVSGDHQAVYMPSRSDLTLGYGFTLQNWASTQAPAIHAANMGTLNTADYGEIRMRNTSEIKNCTSTLATTYDDGYKNRAGGAINMLYAGSIVMDAGSLISGCSTPNGVAGAISMRGSSATLEADGTTPGAAELVMAEGSRIEGCSAKGHGGAVYSAFFFDMQLAGEIVGCEADAGGAISTYKDGFPVYGEGPTLRHHGGIFVLPGAYMADNTATGTYKNVDNLAMPSRNDTGFGGFFANLDWTTLYLMGGTIERCSAPDGVGGVAAGYGVMPYMQDGAVVRDCWASAGGAFGLAAGFLFNGGLIEGCRATGEASSSNMSSVYNGMGGAIILADEEQYPVIMGLTIRDCSAAVAGGGIASPQTQYTPVTGTHDPGSFNTSVEHWTNLDVYGITIEGCEAPVGAGMTLPSNTGNYEHAGAGLTAGVHFMDMDNLRALKDKVFAYHNHFDNLEEVLTPRNPIVIRDNYTPDGEPSNIQTLQRKGVYGGSEDETMIVQMQGEPLEGSYIGFTTGFSQAELDKYNKEGAAFARTSKAANSFDLVSSVYSDRDASLIPTWGSKTNANLEWKQGWAAEFELNAPAGVDGFVANGMPDAVHTALESPLSVPGGTPTDGRDVGEDAKYVFGGWSTEPDGSGALFQPGDLVAADYDAAKAAGLDADGDHRVTLYAVWLPPDPELCFKVSYEAGTTPTGSVEGNAPVDDAIYYKGPNQDGTGIFTVKGNDGDPKLVSTDGYRFRGWATQPGVDPNNPDGVRIFKPGEKVSFKDADGKNAADDYGQVTLYAVWGEKASDEWVVTYEKGGISGVTIGGSAPSDDTLYKKGTPPESGDPADPYTGGDEAELAGQGGMAASGYVLLGWALKDDPGRALYRPGEKIPYSEALDAADGAEDDEVTLVAVWRVDDGRYFTLVETGAGFSTPDTAANEAFEAANQWFEANPGEGEAQIWQHKDFTINNGQDNNIITNKQAAEVLGTTNTLDGAKVKGKTITLASDNAYFDWDEWYAQRDAGTYDDPRHRIIRGASNTVTSFIWHTSGTLVMKDVVIDGADVGYGTLLTKLYNYDTAYPGPLPTHAYNAFQGGFLTVGKMAKKDAEPIAVVMGYGAAMENGMIGLSPGNNGADYQLSSFVFGSASSFVLEEGSAYRNISGYNSTPWGTGIGVVSRGTVYSSDDDAIQKNAPATKVIVKGLMENIDYGVTCLGGIDPWNYYFHSPIYFEFSGNAEVANIKSNVGYNGPLMQVPTNAKLVIGGNASFHDTWTISNSTYDKVNPAASRIYSGMIANDAAAGIAGASQGKGTIELSGTPQFYNNIASPTDPSAAGWNGVGANVDFKIDKGSDNTPAHDYFRVTSDLRVRGEDGQSGPTYVYSAENLDKGQLMGTAWTYGSAAPTTEGYGLDDYLDNSDPRWYRNFGNKVEDADGPDGYTGYWHMVNAWNHDYSAEAVPEEVQYPDQSKIRWTDVVKPARVTFDANSPAGLSGNDVARFDQEASGLPDLGSFDAWAPQVKDGEPFEQTFKGLTPPGMDDFAEIVTEYSLEEADYGTPTKTVSVKLVAPKGYAFAGWTTVKDSDNPDDIYDPSAEFQRPGITVYAKWEKLPDTVSTSFVKAGNHQGSGEYERLSGAQFQVWKYVGAVDVASAAAEDSTALAGAQGLGVYRWTDTSAAGAARSDADGTIDLAGEAGGYSNQYRPLLDDGAGGVTVGDAARPGAGETVKSFVSGSDGMVTLQGLEPDQWYALVETASPQGYQLPAGQWLFKVTADGTIDTASMVCLPGDNGSKPPAFATQVDFGSGAVPGVYCMNVPVFKLPNTGVPFVLSLLAVGMAVLAVAAVRALLRRRTAES